MRNIRKHIHMHLLIYKQVRHIGKHIGEALEYMHANGFIHGDLKPLKSVLCRSNEYICTNMYIVYVDT